MMVAQKLLVAALVVLCIAGFATAQQKQGCIGAQSKEINGTLISGIWWESARSPAPKTNVSCVQMNFEHHNETKSLKVSSAYSETNSTLMNVHNNWNVSLSDYSQFSAYKVVVDNVTFTYKLLTVDYTKHALFCGYTDANNASTVFGFILTRDSKYANLGEIEANASASYIFSEPWTNLTTAGCHTTGGASSTSISLIALLTAAFYALLKCAL